jgi:hypothetical protein
VLETLPNHVYSRVCIFPSCFICISHFVRNDLTSSLQRCKVPCETDYFVFWKVTVRAEIVLRDKIHVDVVTSWLQLCVDVQIVTNISKEHAAFIFSSEDGAIMFLP